MQHLEGSIFPVGPQVTVRLIGYSPIRAGGFLTYHGKLDLIPAITLNSVPTNNDPDEWLAE